MRYTSSHPLAFRNRITRYLGVLVAAALVATLGLPSAAQAQSIGNDGIVYDDAMGFDIKWTTNLDAMKIDNWIVTVTKPDGTKMVVNERSTGASTLGAVTKEEADTLAEDMAVTIAGNSNPVGVRNLPYNSSDLGIWWFQVTACFADLIPAPPDVGTAPPGGTCPSGQSDAGTAVGYTHGAPAAPVNFAANAVPGGVALTWKDMTDDRAITGYEYAFEMTAAGKPDWKNIRDGGKGVQVIDADPGEHTFMLRALGSSDNDTSTSKPISGVAASKMVTVPMPSPTLPEIAMLLLAMLLLGSGAYLLRGRQSGGLTHA